MQISYNVLRIFSCELLEPEEIPVHNGLIYYHLIYSL